MQKLRFLPPAHAIKRRDSFARLMKAVPPSERHTEEIWLAKIASGAVLVFEVNGALLYIEPLDDGAGGRYLHLVGLEGEGFLPVAGDVHRELTVLANFLGCTYFTWMTANERLARAATRRHGARKIAEVYRLELAQ